MTDTPGPYVDRSPPKTPAMTAAYAGLAEAERYVSECHRDADWPAHHEAIAIMVEWHAEIGRLAVSRG